MTSMKDFIHTLVMISRCCDSDVKDGATTWTSAAKSTGACRAKTESEVLTTDDAQASSSTLMLPPLLRRRLPVTVLAPSVPPPNDAARLPPRVELNVP